MLFFEGFTLMQIKYEKRRHLFMIPDGITDTKNVITTVNIFVEVEKGFLEMFVLCVFLCVLGDKERMQWIFGLP